MWRKPFSAQASATRPLARKFLQQVLADRAIEHGPRMRVVAEQERDVEDRDLGHEVRHRAGRGEGEVERAELHAFDRLALGAERAGVEVLDLVAAAACASRLPARTCRSRRRSASSARARCSSSAWPARAAGAAAGGRERRARAAAQRASRMGCMAVSSQTTGADRVRSAILEGWPPARRVHVAGRRPPRDATALSSTQSADREIMAIPLGTAMLDPARSRAARAVRRRRARC